MSDKIFKKLKICLGARIIRNELLAKHTTFRIGGPARYFFEAKTNEAIENALKSAADLNIPYFVLGGGSNVLFSDSGFDGLLIRIKNQELRIKNNLIEAGAGAWLSDIINFSLKNNLVGLEFLVGIPGTVGGAVFGNAGAMGKGLGDFLQSAELLLPDGKIRKVSRKWFKFAYRHSRLKEIKPAKRPVILSAVFKLKKGSRLESKRQIRESLASRLNQPIEPSAGCVFKNYELRIVNCELLKKKFPSAANEELKKWLEYKKIPAGWLIDQCGLRGRCIGGAKISEKHANFIVNTGGAKAEEVTQLISLIKSKVRDKFGLQLQEEIQIVL